MGHFTAALKKEFKHYLTGSWPSLLVNWSLAALFGFALFGTLFSNAAHQANIK